MESIAKVYVTEKYGLFKRLDGNRDIVESRKRKIIKSIQKVGYIINPIIVNEKMEIIDGQGRYEACKELGLPIYFVKAKGAGIDECMAMNISQSNWTMMDYIQSYAELGNLNYIYFLQLKKQFPKFTFDTIYSAATKKVICNGFESSSVIKNQQLVLDETAYEKAIEDLQYLSDINEELKCIPGTSRTIHSAIIWAVNAIDCDRNRIAKIIKKQYPKFRPVPDKNPLTFLEDLSEMYNKHMRIDKCVDFDSEYKKYIREKHRKKQEVEA